MQVKCLKVCLKGEKKRQVKLTGVILVILLETCHQLRAMGKQFLFQGPESRAFSSSHSADTQIGTGQKRYAAFPLQELTHILK